MNKIVTPELDRAAVLRAVLRKDLSGFVQKSFGFLDPSNVYRHNWHIDAMCHVLSEVQRGYIKRLIITLPPRSLKSTCVSVAFVAWLLGHDPSLKIIGASYSMDLSRKLAFDCRALMDAKFYRETFPGTVISPQKNTETEFMTTKRGSRLATSNGGTLTGKGGDILIIDDPLKPEDALSASARERTNQWFSNTAYTRLDDKSVGVIIIVMQRLHIEDLVGYVTGLEDWHCLDLPAIEQISRRVPIGDGQFIDRKPGDLLHPERESLEMLEAIKKVLGNYSFSAQYLQQPIPIDGEIIKWQWFKTYKDLPRRMPNDQIIHSWDTASKSNELSDYSVCTVWHVQGDNFYLKDIIRERLEFPALKKRVIALAWRDNPHLILIEDRASGTPLLQEVRNIKGVRAKAINPEADKITRMQAQSIKVEAGQVHIPDNAPWLGDFKNEVLQFPNGAKDDQVDSMSQFLWWISERKRMRGRVIKTSGW